MGTHSIYRAADGFKNNFQKMRRVGLGPVNKIGYAPGMEAFLQQKTVLITSGPTREPIDPVRFISNASTGRMGKALAECAAEAGARVEFVTGPVDKTQWPQADAIRRHRVTTARDMHETAGRLFPSADIVVFAAAVADYAPVAPGDKKQPKTGGPVALELAPTPDIAAELSGKKQPGQITIGFALQTHDVFEKARNKLVCKNLDAIVLNALDAVGGSKGSYYFLRAGARDFEEWGTLSKSDCALRILRAAADIHR